jgi:hypothetical protein
MRQVRDATCSSHLANVTLTTNSVDNGSVHGPGAADAASSRGNIASASLAENAILMGCAGDQDTSQTKQRSPRRTEPTGHHGDADQRKTWTAN